MPRRPRLDLAHVPQHVVQRGNDRQPCFFTDIDRTRIHTPTTLRSAAPAKSVVQPIERWRQKPFPKTISTRSAYENPGQSALPDSRDRSSPKTRARVHFPTPVIGPCRQTMRRPDRKLNRTRGTGHGTTRAIVDTTFTDDLGGNRKPGPLNHALIAHAAYAAQCRTRGFARCVGVAVHGSSGQGCRG